MQKSKIRISVFLATWGLLALLPWAAGGADYAFEITHSRFLPRQGEAALINYTLPNDAFTTVTVYTLRGERTALLFSGFAHAGAYTLAWSGQNAAGALVASGAYVVHLSAGGFSQTRKVVVVK
jgi:hypothetical protein